MTTVNIKKLKPKPDKNTRQNKRLKSKINYNHQTKIIDLEILQKFNIYYQFLHSYENLKTFYEMKKRSENELEK